MVTVKFFGTFRIDSGMKEMQLEAKKVSDIYEPVMAELMRQKPDSKLTVKDLKACIVAVNSVSAKPGTKLKDGDEVFLVPAVAGG